MQLQFLYECRRRITQLGSLQVLEGGDGKSQGIGRAFFDVSYFVLITVVMLAIVTGVIIGTHITPHGGNSTTSYFD